MIEAMEVDSRTFDIKSKVRGYVDDAKSIIEKPGRCADLYIFAWHPEENEAKADQRLASQWLFYVARTEKLPDGRERISLPSVEKVTEGIPASRLGERVEQEMFELRSFKRDEFPIPRTD